MKRIPRLAAVAPRLPGLVLPVAAARPGRAALPAALASIGTVLPSAERMGAGRFARANLRAVDRDRAERIVPPGRGGGRESGSGARSGRHLGR